MRKKVNERTKEKRGRKRVDEMNGLQEAENKAKRNRDRRKKKENGLKKEEREGNHKK